VQEGFSPGKAFPFDDWRMRNGIAAGICQTEFPKMGRRCRGDVVFLGTPSAFSASAIFYVNN
jgi:hypothetical protein